MPAREAARPPAITPELSRPPSDEPVEVWRNGRWCWKPLDALTVFAVLLVPAVLSFSVGLIIGGAGGHSAGMIAGGITLVLTGTVMGGLIFGRAYRCPVCGTDHPVMPRDRHCSQCGIAFRRRR